MTKEELLSMSKEERKQLSKVEMSTDGNTSCVGCVDCMSCVGCKDCVGIYNGRNLKYVAYGIQLTKEEFESLG